MEKEQESAPEEPVSDATSSEDAILDELERMSEADASGGEAGAEAGEALSADELQTQLDEQRQLAEGYLDQLQRLQADFSNYRRRMVQERSQAADRGKEELLLSLLPVLGNLNLALQHADQDANAVREGVQMIWQQCEEFLRQQGVEQIETVGKPFDPALHEALTMAPATDETPANTVVAEINAGFTLNGQLLRAAQVVVAQADASAAPDTASAAAETEE